MTAFLASESGKLVLLVLAACVVGLLLLCGNKPRKKGRAEELQEQYATLTDELLAATPDEQLVTAVVANLMNKLPRRHPNPLDTFPKLGRGRCGVYFAWLMMKEIEHNGVAALKAKSVSRFNNLGLEGLKMVEATETVTAVEQFLTADGDARAVTEAIEKEQPLSLLAEYIRLNPVEFTDE